MAITVSPVSFARSISRSNVPSRAYAAVPMSGITVSPVMYLVVLLDASTSVKAELDQLRASAVGISGPRAAAGAALKVLLVLIRSRRF